MTSKKNKHRKTANRKSDILIYTLFMIWPTLQFIIFYIGVNGGSFALAFQEWTPNYTFAFNSKEPFAAFQKALNNMFVTNVPYLTNSLLMYTLTLVIGTPLGLFFSYYIYKKFPLSGFFRIILFLPSILSAVVMCTLYKYFVNLALPFIMRNFLGAKSFPFLLDNINYTFGTVLFYCIWTSFGTSVLMYSNKMSAISPEIIEAANLDGATGFKEFWHVVMPHVYPTLLIFFITGIAGLFTNQYFVYSFFGFSGNKAVNNFGYYLFSQSSTDGNEALYPELAATGLLIALVIIPLTLILKKVLTKYGPSEK